MTLKEWYSDRSARTIIRRGLIVASIAAVIALLVQWRFGGAAARPFWGGGVLVPVLLTALKLPWFGNDLTMENQQEDKAAANERKY
jgi:hypothetical protein